MLTVSQIPANSPFNTWGTMPTKALSDQLVSEIKALGLIIEVTERIGGYGRKTDYDYAIGGYESCDYSTSIKVSRMVKAILKPYAFGRVDKRREAALAWEKSNGIKYETI